MSSGVTPDLTTLGKGLANGFPLAAVCGRSDLMKEMEEVFFSFTMGGETMSLAAAEATLDKVMREARNPKHARTWRHIAGWAHQADRTPWDRAFYAPVRSSELVIRQHY